MDEAELTAWKTILNDLRVVVNKSREGEKGFASLDLYESITKEAIESEVNIWESLVPGSRDTFSELVQSEIVHAELINFYKRRIYRRKIALFFLLVITVVTTIITIVI